MDKALLMGEHRASFPDNKFRSTGKEHYEWKIYKNPFMEGFIYLETRDGKVVGSSTATVKRIAILNEVFFAAELGDSFTLPEYRKQGINEKALKYCTEYAITNGINIVYGAPATPGNYRLLVKLGLLPCFHINYTFLTKTLKPGLSILKSIAKILLCRDIRKTFKYLKYLLKRKLQRPRLSHSHGDYDENVFCVEIINIFNKNIDEYWGNPRYSFYVIRDRRYLNWRYFSNPDKYIILAAIKNEEYMGYIVLKMSKHDKTGVICDFITLDDRRDVFLALVKKSEEILKRNGVNLVQTECIVESVYYKTLAELGYFDHGRESHQRIHIYSETQLGKRVLESSGKWHFTLGDTNEV